LHSGKSIPQLFFENEDPEKFPCNGTNCTLHKCITQKRAQSIVLKDVESNNDPTWEERVFSPILDDDEDISYIIESLRDITKVKTREKKYSDVRQLFDKVVQSSRWRRKKSDLLRCSFFTDTRHTACMAEYL
jgi:two-component system NtrC family sensor kinase